MKNDMQTDTRKVGRPRGFSPDDTLRQAMLLFWQHGYEGTSLAALTDAMGITPPSLYAVFGDKKRLFQQAVALYRSGPVTAEQIIDTADSPRDAALGLLTGAAIGFSGAHTPPGCLLASSAISGSPASMDVRAELATIRRRIEARLRRRITKAIKAGSMPAETDPDALAGHVMAVIQGMSTLARDGATRKKLLRIVDVAMQSWPAWPEDKRSRPTS